MINVAGFFIYPISNLITLLSLKPSFWNKITLLIPRCLKQIWIASLYSFLPFFHFLLNFIF